VCDNVQTFHHKDAYLIFSHKDTFSNQHVLLHTDAQEYLAQISKVFLRKDVLLDTLCTKILDTHF